MEEGIRILGRVDDKGGAADLCAFHVKIKRGVDRMTAAFGAGGDRSHDISADDEIGFDMQHPRRVFGKGQVSEFWMGTNPFRIFKTGVAATWRFFWKRGMISL